MWHYIKEIVTQGGSCQSFRFPSWEKGQDIVASICDETGKNYLIQSKTDLSGELLGFGLDKVYMSGCLVVFNAKVAKLHDYIESAETICLDYSDDARDVTPPGWDMYALDTGYTPKRYSLHGRRNIVIHTSIDSIEVSGILGSVASRSGSLGSNPRLLPLYDLLGELCRETGVNLLQYRTIRLSSSLRSRSTEIKLKHDAAADRFFTKMYLDVIGR